MHKLPAESQGHVDDSVEFQKKPRQWFLLHGNLITNSKLVKLTFAVHYAGRRGRSRDAGVRPPRPLPAEKKTFRKLFPADGKVYFRDLKSLEKLETNTATVVKICVR